MNPRTIGHRWERTCVKYLRDLFGFSKDQIKSSRAESKSLDDKGVDIWVDPSINFPFYIQCKSQQINTIPKINIEGLLNIKLTGKINLLFVRLTKKVNVKQTPIGEYVVLKMDDFLRIIEQYNASNSSSNSK